MNERELIPLLQAGDEEAFKILVNTYKQMVFTTCFGFVHNSESAEDLTQEVFIQVYKSITRFRSDSLLSTWIYRIAINKSLNATRKVKRNIFLRIDEWFSDESKTDIPDSSANTPSALLENNERIKHLSQAVSKLSTNQMKAFILSKYQGLSNKEVANIMASSVSAVEALLNRAKKNLQKRLIEYYRNS